MKNISENNADKGLLWVIGILIVILVAETVSHGKEQEEFSDLKSEYEDLQWEFESYKDEYHEGKIDDAYSEGYSNGHSDGYYEAFSDIQDGTNPDFELWMDNVRTTEYSEGYNDALEEYGIEDY